ncbi:hypothetical protein HAINFHK1212_1367 [Haemophilus influenzae HK1212]|uniref:Uncharacterized protein n=1 Tax=Haemophilus influenzae HK1212 TaxID=456482 RepID=A0A7G2JVT6_HAEIF|nr:hypothetical protein HAINFHK1212_1367 [Haemophilus influenzae HK1212]
MTNLYNRRSFFNCEFFVVSFDKTPAQRYRHNV